MHLCIILGLQIYMCMCPRQKHFFHSYNIPLGKQIMYGICHQFIFFSRSLLHWVAALKNPTTTSYICPSHGIYKWLSKMQSKFTWCFFNSGFRIFLHPASCPDVDGKRLKCAANLVRCEVVVTCSVHLSVA